MNKRNKNLKSLYPNALPISLSNDYYGTNLPDVIPHNPVSWVIFAASYLYIVSKPIPRNVIKVYLENGTFKVSDTEDMNRLWSHGFFGKGSLSRSDPSWMVRTSIRLGIGANKGIASEEITKQRRDERKTFKQERAKLQSFELKQRQGVITELESSELIELREKLNHLKSSGHVVQKHKGVLVSELRDEDEVLLEDGGLENIEYLQLQPIESSFLSFALNTIEVYQAGSKLSTRQLFGYCHQQDPNFFMHYAVYHHFRSLGWCVRSGIKFGCDMLLYKRGPPFSHAEFAILIIPAAQEYINWIDISAVARVIGGVKKNFVLCFVDEPKESFNANTDIEKFLGDFKITEILYRRWSPSRSRD